MRPLPLLFVLVSISADADDPAHHHDFSPVGDAQVIVTINPEARVSAVLSAPLPLPRPCGSAEDLEVKVINQGFVTSPLRASIVGDSAQHVRLQMDSKKLTGAREDSRTLHVTPLGPGPADITIAFSIDNNIGDLGGRDRVHFLVRCLP